MNILQILEHINSDTKRTHKLDVVKSNKDNSLFMKTVSYALDPYKNFYIKKIPQYNTPANPEKDLAWALSELDKLSTRSVTGHAGIAHLTNILCNISADDAIVVERVIGKDLRCGASDATINAIIENFIPTYPCLLARPYDEKNIKNINFKSGVYSQLKVDGLRVNFHCNGNQITVCGRSGRDIDLLGVLDELFIELASKFTYPVVFDGELVVVDSNNKILPRKIGNGIINKAIKGTISLEEAKSVRVQLWDVIPANEFKAGKSKNGYTVRFNSLINAVNNEEAVIDVLRGGKKYWVIPYKIVYSLEEAQEHFQDMISAGEEGTILKSPEHLWEDSRSKYLVKMKSEKEADLYIKSWNPGTGKFEGKVGSLICSSSDNKVEVAISGFSDALRDEITKNINSLLNTIVEVTYNERISSQESGRSSVDSLFLPRFSRFRIDKTIANSSDEIK